MAEIQLGEERVPSPMSAVSNAMVALHKEQFGRGPTRATSHFAGDDTLVCVLEDVLLPAERSMVAMGDHHRVREQRTYMQVATARQFTAAVEAIVGTRGAWVLERHGPGREHGVRDLRVHAARRRLTAPVVRSG